MTKTATAPTSAHVEIDAAVLRERRQNRGDTQAELAVKVGVTAQYIGQLENTARRRMRPGTFVKLCDALGIAEDERNLLRKKPAA